MAALDWEERGSQLGGVVFEEGANGKRVQLGGAIVSDRKEHAGLAQVVPITAAPYFPEGRRPRCFRYNDHWRCSDGSTTMDCTENLCWPLCGVSR